MQFRTELPPAKQAAAPVGRDPLAAQIDELQRISEVERNAQMGESWQKEVDNLYSLKEADRPTPTFRPRVEIPQLQILTLNEATDLTDNNPRILITDRSTKKRDEAHEQGLMAHWNQQFWSNQIMLAEIWSLLSCIGYIQIGFDPLANRGQGKVWARCRDPKTVFPDPAAMCDEDMAYVIFEDRLYLDEVRRRWPDQGWKVKPTVNAKVEGPGEGSHSFQMPPGPMSVVPGLPTASQPEGDGRVRVRHMYCKDSTVEDIPGARPGQPTKRPKYPHGRLITECEGVILFDGENPMPLGMFPLVSFVSMPRLNSYFPPSAVRYSKGLQDLATKLLTQIYENTVRMNNGLVLIKDDSGISLDNFGGVPAEVHVVSGNSQNPVQVIYPSASLPAQVVQLPQQLLDLQRMIQGFTPARMGEPTQGNVSKDLYGMGIYESQKLTRMRGRLMAESVQRMGELAFYSMAKFYTVNITFPVFQQDAQDAMTCDWNPIEDSKISDMDVHLDPSSIRPVSATAMRQLAPTMRQLGLIGTEEALTAMDWPDAKNVAQQAQNEQRLAALAALTSKGKK